LGTPKDACEVVAGIKDQSIKGLLIFGEDAKDMDLS
jgi:hypothetical protein